MHRRFAAGIAASLLGFAASGTAVVADPAPVQTPIVLPSPPPAAHLSPYAKAAIDLVTGLARRTLENDANRAQGDVTFFRRFEMQVRVAPNRYRNVHLHQGTRIDPRGATVQPGDRVAIGGSGQPDGSLDADAITILR